MPGGRGRSSAGGRRPGGRGFRPVPVSLELLPWSSRWSELTLTTGPLRRRDSGARAERAYLLAAHATLERLARAIEGPPAEWVARLVGGQPWPQIENVTVVSRPRPPPAPGAPGR